MILIGYSGHAYIAICIIQAGKMQVEGYCDKEEKQNNPFDLKYFGSEDSATGRKALADFGFFIAIGDNKIRKNIFDNLSVDSLLPANIVHPSAIIDQSVRMENYGIMIGAGVIINPLSVIGIGVICNTGCIVEHECWLGNFAHIAPGAILCGNVRVGAGAFIGANAVIRQGIKIGANAIIGAGSVVVKNVDDYATIMGNPAKHSTEERN